MIKKFDLSLYDRFKELSLRYFELHPNDEKESLIFSASINIDLGVQDIERCIDKINNENNFSETGWYYELIVKTYQILGAFRAIEQKFQILKSGPDELYGPPNEKDGSKREEERQKIDYFRALRSLTTAHTLETTDKAFDKFNINANTYLEDVRSKKSYRMSHPDLDGDIILEIRKKEERIWLGVWEM